MEWKTGLMKMLDKALEKNVPAMMRVEAKNSFIEEAERHAEERNAVMVEEEDLMYVAYLSTPPDKIEIMEQTYRELGIDVDEYKPASTP